MLTGVVQSNNGTPIHNATVTVTGTTYSGVTDMYGVFSIANLPTGLIGLTVTADTYEIKSLTGILVQGGTNVINPIQLNPLISLVAISSHSVTTGNPHALQVTIDKDGQVYLISSDYSVTSISGLYDILNISGKTASATVTANTYSEMSTVGLYAGTYNLYAVDNQDHLSGVLATVTVSPDTTKPVLSGATSGIISPGDNVSATSSKDGQLYLVPAGTPADTISITSNAWRSTSVTANNPGGFATIEMPAGDYVAYAIDMSGNVSDPSGIIQIRVSQSTALADIRYGLDIANMTWIDYYEMESAGLVRLNPSNTSIYQYAFGMDRITLLGFSTDADLIAALQVWVDIANDTPVIHNAMIAKIYATGYDWSNVTPDTFSGYGFTGINNASQFAVVKELLQRAFEYYPNTYKLLSKTTIQNVINSAVPYFSAAVLYSGWNGSGVAQFPGSQKIQLAIAVRNSSYASLKGYVAGDFSVMVNGTGTSFSDPAYFSDFHFNDSTQNYEVMFKGTADNTTYVLTGLTVSGVLIQDDTVPFNAVTPPPVPQ